MTLYVEIPNYNCKSVFSLKSSMERRGEMWLCIASVLVWYLGGSFASERYVFPVSATNSTFSHRYGIIAGAGQVTGRWKIRYPFPVFNSGNNYVYSMNHAFNPEMKNYRVGTSDSNLSFLLSFRRDKPVIPISNLGNKYIFSSCQIPRPIKTEMIIASHVINQPTEVKVTFSIQGNISHNGKTYVDGDSLNFNIGALETVYFNSEFDLTGTTITSNATVAVFVRLQPNVNYISFEQLIPVTHFGTNYVVATGSRELYRLHIIGEHNDTIITFNNGTQAILRNRPNQGRMPSFLQAVGANQSFHFMSSKPVMAILCQFDFKGDPTDLAVVPPVAFYTKYPFVATTSSECKFMTENANTSNAVVHSTRPYQLTWENVTNSSFRVGTFVSISQTQFQLNFTSKVGVLCFSYSSIHNGGFGTMVNSNDSQHGNEFIIPTGLPWSIYYQNHDRNGYLEIESSIPSNSFNSRYQIYTFLDTCIMVTDELSSLNLYGSIDSSQFPMLPVSALGLKYVISSCYPLNNQTTVLMITTHDKATEVDITLNVDAAYTYDGNTYYNGDVISYSLQSCSTVSLFFNVDVTGTMIEAKHATIAVFSGGTAGGVSTLESLEQLLPVSQHGTEHVLAVPLIRGALLQIVTAHQNAEVTFNPGESLSLGNTRRFNWVWNESETLVLTSSHPVMATLCRKRGFVIIPPVHSYRNAHSVSLRGMSPITIKIVMDGTNDLNISNVGGVLWQNVSEYRVGTQRLFQTPEVHISSVDKFTVLYFATDGDLVNGGYNFSKEPYEKVLPPKNDDDWSIYGIAAGTGLSVTTSLAFGGGVWCRRRRRQEAERSNRERSQAQVDRQVRPSHPGAEESPPTFKV